MVEHGQIGHRVQNALFLLIVISTPEKGEGGGQEEGGFIYTILLMCINIQQID